MDGVKKNYPFTLEHLSTDSQRALITVNIQALNEDEKIDPDHHTRIYLNDTLIGDIYWDGPYNYHFSGEVNHTLLSEGENILSIEQVGDTVEYDLIYFNSFYVAYYRKYIASEDRLFFNTSAQGKQSLWGFKEDDIILYDITDPDSPRRLIDPRIESWGDEYSVTFNSRRGLRDYVAFAQEQIEHPSIEKDIPSQLNHSSAGADYIVISHPMFLSTIQQLADYRANKGMRVVVADVEEIYDEFSFGNFNPEAIRLFLTYARNNWAKPSPSNVLLVGSGTFDFKDYLGFGIINYIPPYLIETESMQTASDKHYVSVKGEDSMPEMAIGRLPVRDTVTLERIINRIIQYETIPLNNGMENRIFFVADDIDQGGDFENDIEWLIENCVPVEVEPSKVFLSQLGVADTREEILNQFNLGNLILHYQGHGTINLWASENIFDNDDAFSLGNAPKFPFVETMTCLNGYFFNPYTKSLAEELLSSETGGAIAVWSSTGLSSDNAMKYLADKFLQEIYTKNNRQVGSAINNAKLNLLQYGPFYDEINTFILFGDPALQLW
jgi:hypothetical protein